MNRKLSNAPIFYALGQIRFNPVAAIAKKYLADIQESFRGQGYTLFENRRSIGPQPSEESSNQNFQPNVEDIWSFTKSDRSSGFILNSSSISFHTTMYETSQEFIPEIVQGFMAVNKVMGLDHISRIGLRYLDAIVPDNNESLEDYLVPVLHGVKIGTKKVYSLYESVSKTPLKEASCEGTLLLRLLTRNAVLGFPPDIHPPNLAPIEKFTFSEPTEHAVVDTDHFYNEMVSTDKFESLNNRFIELHEHAKDVFKMIITEHAEDKWS